MRVLGRGLAGGVVAAVSVVGLSGGFGLVADLGSLQDVVGSPFDLDLIGEVLEAALCLSHRRLRGPNSGKSGSTVATARNPAPDQGKPRRRRTSTREEQMDTWAGKRVVGSLLRRCLPPV
ncbi:MAG TPA: hypothetical protein VLL48_14225, partial [Longimicrobiales bacterium]|nr:hypothetical protein [Longimicrobiales bacterium]